MSFASEFNHYYSRLLNSYGFSKLKGTHIFAKLINETVLQYFTFHGVPSIINGKKAFSMLAGVDTIYAETLSKSHLQAFAFDYRAFRWIDSSLNQKGAYWNIYHYDEDSMIEALQDAANETVSSILPCISKVDNLEKYVDFCKYMCPIRLYYADRLNLDSILLIKTNNHDSFDDLFTFRVSLMAQASLLNGGNGYISPEEKQGVMEDIQIGIVAPRDNVYSNSLLLKSIDAELFRRKFENKNMLRCYNIKT